MQEESKDGARATRGRRGSPLAGIRDVAKLAGVSTATVSRVFNSPDSVSEKVRTKVTQAASTLSYIPHNAARALSSQRSRTLGIVIPSVQNSIFAEQVEWLQRRAATHGYSLVVALSGFDAEGEAKQIFELVRNGIDGVMLVGAEHLPEVYDLLRTRDIAYVNTSISDPASPHPNVGIDNRAAMSQAANYLLSLGHRDIGLVCGDVRTSDRARHRLEGTLQALDAAGIPRDDSRIHISDYSMSGSRAACRDLMRAHPETTAIMCHNDVQAFATLLELQSLGHSVPGDVSVTGFDDLEWARHLSPALTTVRVPWGDMAEIAADMLVAQLSEQEYRHSTTLDFDVVVRESSAPPRDRS